VTLAAYLLAAMHVWAPVVDHAYVEASAITEARYQAIAADVASVALDPAEVPLFAGTDARPRTAVLLLAVASLESGGFRGDVAFCRASGDHGHAWGLFQSHRSTGRVCSSTREATRVAIEQMRESFVACEREEPAVWLAAYASGSCSRGWVAARRRWAKASEWMAQHPWGGAS
jgi:hypothetical protein